MDKKTPLYDTHVKAKGKIVSFAGYLLPVQYEGVMAEHMAVRERCGLFDVSHMGEFVLTGKDAGKNLNALLTNDYSHMEDGQARYSPMCNEQGGVVDDLIVYKVREDHYFIVVNAANKEKDLAWMQAHIFGDAVCQDVSDRVALIALQGPKADQILKKLVPDEVIPKKYYTCKFDQNLQGIRCGISKTGYTGEEGYEFYLEGKDAPAFWDLLMKAGKEEGLAACGLGARDTLRLEAAMPLYGHEMDDEITPLETGLGSFVKMEKQDFTGKSALLKSGEPKRLRVGLKVVGRGIVREQMDVYGDGKLVGKTTSGTHCPYLGYAVAMALLSKDYTQPGTRVEVEVRGRKVEAEVVSLPFYKRKKQ